MGERGPDPFAAVEALLAKADGQGASRRRATLEAALALLSEAAFPAAPAAAESSPRADAYRAECLKRLGRREEAARAYGRVVESVLENAEAVHRGLQDLLDALCGYDEVLRLLPAVLARHPGRAWQWTAIREEAEKRRGLEAEAPLDAAALDRLRERVARRLSRAPCGHDDDRRPVAAEEARALGLDPGRVLPWLSGLGACCCDCQVVTLRGPWEARRA